MDWIDFRSDTVTRPDAGMRKAMAEADVGDDVYGDDPTVNRLEERGAEMLGKEASLFATSGTQTNLLALLVHCERGDEYIVGQEAHTFRFEGGGAAVLGSIQPQPIDFDPDGTLPLDKVEAAIKPDDFHFARTRLLCLENTQAGKVLPLEYQARASALAHARGLGIHLDGARLFNASVKLAVDVREISRHFDTVSVCLSKGLGAPVGSLVCGPAEAISRARRWRKVLGGGMRQAGIIAAGGLYALEHNVARMAEDHENAAHLAGLLAGMDEVEVAPRSGETNMVFARLRRGDPGHLASFLKERGILILGESPLRFVTHLNLRTRDMDALANGIKDFLARKK